MEETLITKETLTEKFADLRGIGQQTREYTPEEMTFAFVEGYNYGITVTSRVLERAVVHRKSLFGKHEERVFDDDFIKKFKEETKIK